MGQHRHRGHPAARRPGPARHAVGYLLAAVLLTSCTAPAAEDGSPAQVSASSSQLPEPSGPNDVGADHPTPLPYPTDDAASAAEAAAVATAAMTAFARPATPAQTWWAELAPLLTPTAQAAYAGTDPAQVPASAVTGPASATASGSTYLATVGVPTDVGTYEVLLVRDGAGAPWLIERLTPPPELPGS